MKNCLFLLVFANLFFITGCYTSNQMVISGNRSGGSNGVQRTHTIPSSTSFQPPKPKAPSYVSQKQSNPINNKSDNTNINTQTTTIYLTNNPSSVNVITNTTTSNFPRQTEVREFIIEESVIPGKYYIIQ